MHTIEAQWQELHQGTYSHLTPDYLAALYPHHGQGQITYVNGACLPTDELISKVAALTLGQALYTPSGQLIAYKTDQPSSRDTLLQSADAGQQLEATATIISYPEDILRSATDSFIAQYEKATQGETSKTLDDTNRVLGDQLFVADDVVATCAIINTTDGPVYLDQGVTVMEGAVIKGPAYIGPHSRIHVNTQVYAGTMLGPHCRIGGEIKRTSMFGYSNKAHGGYLGDSVLGKWCNLGAATNNSNMKNTYGKVNLWDIANEEKRKTDHQFLGSILGDHTMTAIQTSLNTGTVTGIFANLIDRQPTTYVSSFSWGADQRYDVKKAIAVATHAMSRRDIEMPEAYATALHHLSDDR